MALQLKVIAGAEKDKGRSFDLPEQGSLHLGRGPDTDSRFNDVRVSGSHCRVYVQGGQVTISDNGSTNGTFVNERPLVADEIRDLAPGDVIRLGENTKLEVAGDDIAVMKTVAGNAGMLARELAAAAARVTPPPRPAAAPVRPSTPPAPAPRPSRMQPAEPTVDVVCDCGQQLVAREKYAGTKVRCPNCRNVLQLPGRPALAQPVLDDELTTAPSPAAKGKTALGRLLTIAAAFLLLMATGACLAALFSDGGKSANGAGKAAVEQAQRSQTR
jgi:predicted component of type VI protein secretion system